MGPAAGSLNKYVTLRHNIAANNRGQVEVGIAPYAQVWAAIEPLSGREIQAAGSVSADVSTKVRIRWRDDVRPTDSISLVEWGRERLFEVESVMDMQGTNEELWLFVRETAT